MSELTTLCIIDADVVAYMACDNRYMNSDGYHMVSLDEIEFSDDENKAYLGKAWLRFQEIIQELCDTCYTDDYVAAVKGDNNFRNEIYPEYKANRHADPKKRNPFVPLLRQMAVDAGIAVAAHGMEADDMLRIWQQECVAQGRPYIICSIDKDLKCMPGRHYLMHKNKFLDVSEAEAIRFYYEQLLQGDPTDNIKGIPKVGPIKAQKYLQECNTEAEFQYTVTESYQSYFGNTWREELLLNGKLIYLKKTFEDEFDLVGWNICPYTPYVPPPDVSTFTSFEPTTPTESVLKTVTPWEQVLSHGNLTGQLKEANDKLEATIANGMVVPKEPEPFSFFPVINTGLQQDVVVEIAEKVEAQAKSLFELPPVVPVPTVGANWGKKK